MTKKIHIIITTLTIAVKIYLNLQSHLSAVYAVILFKLILNRLRYIFCVT